MSRMRPMHATDPSLDPALEQADAALAQWQQDREAQEAVRQEQDAGLAALAAPLREKLLPGKYCVVWRWKSRSVPSFTQVNPATCAIASASGMCRPAVPMTTANSPSKSNRVEARGRTMGSSQPTRLSAQRMKSIGYGGVSRRISSMCVR